jgi:hypothetical protein
MPICADCLAYFAAKIHGSTRRRRILIPAGAAIGLAAGGLGLAFLLDGDLIGWLLIAVAVSCAVSTAVNVIRLRQYREFLVLQAYPHDQKGSS